MRRRITHLPTRWNQRAIDALWNKIRSLWDIESLISPRGGANEQSRHCGTKLGLIGRHRITQFPTSSRVNELCERMDEKQGEWVTQNSRRVYSLVIVLTVQRRHCDPPRGRRWEPAPPQFAVARKTNEEWKCWRHHPFLYSATNWRRQWRTSNGKIRGETKIRSHIG